MCDKSLINRYRKHILLEEIAYEVCDEFSNNIPTFLKKLSIHSINSWRFPAIKIFNYLPNLKKG